MDRVARAAYRYIPSTYLVCENDVHMPPPFQEAFSSFAEAEIERCSAGHAENIDCSNQGYANGVGLTSLFYQDADGQSTDFS